ncbi:MAG: glycolate oxidase subunit GlcE [Gammaproteobacteria bacterium]|nr:MAG: glycolate oxidase subunit GlcE [Gammaproteobacteria bacterium]
MTEQNLTDAWCERVTRAAATHTPLCIRGGNSKAFYGRTVEGETLDTRRHCGVLEYEPSELVIRARAGTPLAEVEKLLDQQQQMLAFEPPHFSPDSTLGGAVATGLSGSRRPFSGSARDAVLGVGLVNGKGESLNFGGQVMKNVAGYDLSRLMAGALGTLGLLTDISLKVLPKPEKEYILKQVCTQPEALLRFSDWMAKPLPLSAACWHDDHLYLRLSGTEAGIRHAQHQLGDTMLEQDPSWWTRLRDHRLEFFQRNEPLWRLSVPPATPPLAIAGDWLIDWAGGQRWLYSNESTDTIRHIAGSVGGHATLFRNTDHSGDIFHPLPTSLFKLQQRLKQAFDPAGILNPGRLYEDL